MLTKLLLLISITLNGLILFLLLRQNPDLIGGESGVSPSSESAVMQSTQAQSAGGDVPSAVPTAASAATDPGETGGSPYDPTGHSAKQLVESEEGSQAKD